MRGQGPYRECFEDMMEEACSPALPMFIPCPNGENKIGDNRCIGPEWDKHEGVANAAACKKLCTDCPFYSYNERKKECYVRKPDSTARPSGYCPGEDVYAAWRHEHTCFGDWSWNPFGGKNYYCPSDPSGICYTNCESCNTYDLV